MSSASSQGEPRSDDESTDLHAEVSRFERLVGGLDDYWPGFSHLPRDEGREPSHSGDGRHLKPFMGRAVFSFGRRDEEPSTPPAPPDRAPCPLCGEPNRLLHAYCKRCSFRLPWAASIEGLPETAPRLNRLDQAVGRALAESAGARCRFCESAIEPYDRRCRTCGRWLASARPQSGLDAWQPDFDAWNLSQVRGLKTGGCLSPIIFVTAFILWRVLS